MHGAGDDFFSSAGFALNQGLGIAFGDHTNDMQDLLKREASSHHLVGGGGAQFAIHKILFLSHNSELSAAVPRGLLAASLSGDPLANVWIAIHQCDAGRFAPVEKIDADPTRQSHILKVENHVAPFLFRGD
jgi:hypothetical protein